MKKLLGFLVLGLLVCNIVQAKDGQGDIKFDKRTLSHFQKYLTGVGNPKDAIAGFRTGTPILFAVTPSGKYSSYFYCPNEYKKKYGCVTYHKIVGRAQNKCKKYAKKNGSSERCYIFAIKYKIVWNSVDYKIPKKANFEEIEKIMIDLGFYGQQASKKIEKTESKITKKSKKKMSDDFVQELKELKQLYDDGVLTQEEFTKAKNKLLN